MKKRIFLISSIVSLLLIGCGGSSNGESTSESKTGYLADSGIEGLKYKTSDGFVRKTKKDGLFNCKENTTVTFYLGKTQIGEPVECTSKPITPIELFCETEDTYQNNPEVVNTLRLLQTLDSDAVHSNGIVIDDNVFTMLEDENVDFNDIDTLYKKIKRELAVDELVSETDAIINFQDTLSSIKANVFVNPSEKVKLFNSYSSDYFRLQRSIVDKNTKATENNIKVMTSAFQASVSAVSSSLGQKGAILTGSALDYAKEQATTLLLPLVFTTLNLQPKDDAIAQTITKFLVNFILVSKADSKSEQEAIIALTKDLVAGQATIAGYTFAQEDEATIAQTTNIVNLLVYAYDLAAGDVQTKIASTVNVVAGISSTTALIFNTNNFITQNGSLLVAQGYLELYYRNGETKQGVINAINNNKLWNNNQKLLDNATYDSILATIAQGYYLENKNPWYKLLSEDDYNIDEVKKIIDNFEYNFELLYKNKDKTIVTESGIGNLIASYLFNKDQYNSSEIFDVSTNSNNLISDKAWYNNDANILPHIIDNQYMWDDYYVELNTSKFTTNNLSNFDMSKGLTISLLVKTNDLELDNPILSIVDKNTSDITWSASLLGINLYYPSHSGWKFSLGIKDQNEQNYQIYPSNEAEIQTNKFYHILYTIAPTGKIRVFYNGEEGIGANINNIKIFNLQTENLKILLGGGMSSSGFIGGVDNIKIFNSVLNDDEIQSVWNENKNYCK